MKKTKKIALFLVSSLAVVGCSDENRYARSPQSQNSDSTVTHHHYHHGSGYNNTSVIIWYHGSINGYHSNPYYNGRSGGGYYRSPYYTGQSYRGSSPSSYRSNGNSSSFRSSGTTRGGFGGYGSASS